MLANRAQLMDFDIESNVMICPKLVWLLVMDTYGILVE